MTDELEKPPKHEEPPGAWAQIKKGAREIINGIGRLKNVRVFRTYWPEMVSVVLGSAAPFLFTYIDKEIGGNWALLGYLFIFISILIFIKNKRNETITELKEA